MKKFLILINIFLLFIFFPIISFAQENKGGISISPATVEIQEGESYELLIKNNENKTKNISLIPAIFQLDPVGKSMKLLDKFNEINTEEIDLSSNIDIRKSNITIPANSSETIEVKYKKKLSDDTYLGVLISDSPSKNSTIGVSSRLTSIILDFDLTPKVLGLVDNLLGVDSDFNISKFSFSNDIQIQSSIKNNTSRLIKASGQIAITKGTTRLENISLTQKLPPYIFPSTEVNLETNFKDTRAFWKRVGFTTYTQTIKVNNQSLSTSVDVFTLPWQLLLITLFLIFVLLFSYIFFKRKHN